jgi:hypothetical protein
VRTFASFKLDDDDLGPFNLKKDMEDEWLIILGLSLISLAVQVSATKISSHGTSNVLSR